MSLVFTGQWRLFRRLFNGPRFQAKLKVEVGKAGRTSAEALRGAIIKKIDDKTYAANSAFTIAMKGSSTPLVDKGDLRRSIRTKVISWNTAFVGVLARTRVGGKSMVNVGSILHDGATIRVTPKMRLWFAAQASTLGMRPLSASTTVIRIPGRPFIRSVVETAGAQGLVVLNYERASDAAFNDTSPAYKAAL